MTATDPGEVAGRPIHVSETLTSAMAADRSAVHATTALYTAHYRSLVGLAVLLVRDVSTAEELVAFLGRNYRPALTPWSPAI